MIIGSEIHFVRDIESTNTYASKLLDNEPSPVEGTIIYTNFQSAGRGQMGNRWESEDGKNLLLSVIIYPDMILPEDQFLISGIVTLGICDFLKNYLPIFTIKWPNDIYAGNDKIAGVLIENSINDGKIENSIIGIGLNLNQTIFKSDAPNPVSLKMITGKDYNIEKCLKQLAACLDKRYKQVLAGKEIQVKEDFNSHLYRINEWHKFSASGKIFTGRIKGVSDNGHLLVETIDGTTSSFSFKEIIFII